MAAYAAIQRGADREILAGLRLAYKDVGRQLSLLAQQRDSPAHLERQRLLAIKKAILEAQAEFYGRTGETIQRRRVQAAARAIQVSQRYDESVFALAGRTEDLHALSDSLEETEARAPDALVARLTGSRVPLSERVYRTRAYTQGLLDRRINSGLARGLSAQQLAREVRDLVNPNTPGGVQYAALRLARTEINNAYHAMAIRAAELKPWVTKLEWHTSGSHARPDECDQLNGRLFEPADTPRKPHPQCLCYVTQVIGDPDKSNEENDDDFLDDLVGGLFDQEIADITAGTPAPAAPALPAPPVKAAKKAVKKAAPAAQPESQEFAVPHINNVPEGVQALRLLPDDPTLRREMDLQEAITPNAAGQLFAIEVLPQGDLGAGVGGVHNRALRRIQIARSSDGTEGRAVYDKAERSGFHPHCGHDHSTVQLHLAHEYGHHVHQMLDFMPIADRVDLWNTVADAAGVPRPQAPDLSHDFADALFAEVLPKWMAHNRNKLEQHFGRYGMTNERELMAEIWSAYSTSPDTKNKAIRTIGAKMRQLAEAGAVRGKISRPEEDIERLAEKIKKAIEAGLL